MLTPGTDKTMLAEKDKNNYFLITKTTSVKTVLLIVFFILKIFPDNLIQNGNFEHHDQNGLAQGWLVNNNGQKVKTSVRKTGTGNIFVMECDKIDSKDDHGPVLYQTNDFKFTEKKYYSFSFFAKADREIIIHTAFQNTALLISPGFAELLTITNGKNHYSFDFYANHTPKYACGLFFSMKSPGRLEISDISLTETGKTFQRREQSKIDIGKIKTDDYPVKSLPEWTHYTYNGEKWIIKQITDNEYNDWIPRMDAYGNITWFGDVMNDWSGTFYYSAKDKIVHKIPQEHNKYSWHCLGSDISQGKVALYEYLGGDKFGIFIYDGEKREKKRICPDFKFRPGHRTHFNPGRPFATSLHDVYAFHPSIELGQIAFTSWDDTDFEIYLWNGNKLLQITDNEYDDYFPVLSKGAIAYMQWYSRSRIMLWDGQKHIDVSSRVLNNPAAAAVDIWVYDKKVIFESGKKLYLWENEKTKNLTESIPEFHYQFAGHIEKDIITWGAVSPSRFAPTQLFTYRNNLIDNFANCTYALSGCPNETGVLMVFSLFDGNDYEICFARKAEL